MIESLYSFQASGCGEAPRSEARPYVYPTVIVHDLLKTLNLVAPEHLCEEYACEHDVASADRLLPPAWEVSSTSHLVHVSQLLQRFEGFLGEL